MAKKGINRIKIVLVEQGRTNKWLADKLQKSATTVSRWCTNDMQPSLETLVQISEVIKVDVRELLVSNKK
jgi:putative transcriptional regulator